jgi:hypothetical protein
VKADRPRPGTRQRALDWIDALIDAFAGSRAARLLRALFEEDEFERKTGRRTRAPPANVLDGITRLLQQGMRAGGSPRRRRTWSDPDRRDDLPLRVGRSARGCSAPGCSAEAVRARRDEILALRTGRAPRAVRRRRAIVNKLMQEHRKQFGDFEVIEFVDEARSRNCAADRRRRAAHLN